MNSKKRLHLLLTLFVVLLTIVGVIVGMWARIRPYQGIGVWKLTDDLVYDETMQEMMEQSKLQCLLWKLEQNVAVTNPDFARTTVVDVMEIAGDSSLFFSGENCIQADQMDACILGVDTARDLFGSTKVSGRKVQIADKTYQVAGIEYQVKQLVIYELDSNESQTVDHVLYRYTSAGEQSMVEQSLRNTLGIMQTEDLYKTLFFYGLTGILK